MDSVKSLVDIAVFGILGALMALFAWWVLFLIVPVGILVMFPLIIYLAVKQFFIEKRRADIKITAIPVYAMQIRSVVIATKVSCSKNLKIKYSDTGRQRLEQF